jgi:hypothetical protein
MAEEYLSAPFVKKMLQQSFVVQVLSNPRDLSKNSLKRILDCSHGDNIQSSFNAANNVSIPKPAPSLFYIQTDHGPRYFERGEVVDGFQVRRQAGIVWGAQGSSSSNNSSGIDTRPPMRKKGWKLFTVFICHRAYKIDEESLLMFMRDSRCRSLNIIGSGGSCQRSGGMGPDIKSAFDTIQIIGQLSSDQQLNDMNFTLVEAAMNNRVISIFLGAETYNHIRNHPELRSLKLKEMNKKDFMFLGYFEIVGQSSTLPTDISKIPVTNYAKPQLNVSFPQQMLRRWAEGRAFSVTCTLLEDKLLSCLPVWDSQNNRLVAKKVGVLREIVIVDSNLTQIQIPVKKEYLNNVLSCTKGSLSSTIDIYEMEEVTDLVTRSMLVDIHCNPNTFPHQVFSRVVFSENNPDTKSPVVGNFLRKEFNCPDSFHSLQLSRLCMSTKFNPHHIYKYCIANTDQQTKKTILKLLLSDLEIPNICPGSQANKSIDLHCLDESYVPKLSTITEEETNPHCSQKNVIQKTMLTMNPYTTQYQVSTTTQFRNRKLKLSLKIMPRVFLSR